MLPSTHKRLYTLLKKTQSRSFFLDMTRMSVTSEALTTVNPYPIRVCTDHREAFSGHKSISPFENSEICSFSNAVCTFAYQDPIYIFSNDGTHSIRTPSTCGVVGSHSPSFVYAVPCLASLLVLSVTRYSSAIQQTSALSIGCWGTTTS